MNKRHIMILMVACAATHPNYPVHPFFKITGALAALVGGSYFGNKAYQEYRFFKEKRDLSRSQRAVVLTVEVLGNDCKLFQEQANRQRLEDLLKQRFTVNDGAAPNSPSIGEYQAQVKTIRNQHETIDETYRDKVEDWKEAERYKPMVPAALTLIADNEKILKQVKTLEMLVGQGIPFVQLLLTYVKAAQETEELRKARDTQASILNRYRDPQFPYPFVKCVKELQELQQELSQAEKKLQTNGRGSQNLSYESTALRNDLEKILRSISAQFYQQQKEQVNHEYRLREVQALEQQAKVANERLQEERRKNDLKQAEIVTNARIVAECREQLQVQKRNLQTLENEAASLRKALDFAHQDELRIQKDLNGVKEKLASFEQRLTSVPVNPETLDKDVREWWQGLQTDLAKLRQTLDELKRAAAPAA